MNYSSKSTTNGRQDMLKEEFVLIPDGNFRYSPAKVNISDKWENFFKGSDNATGRESVDSGIKLMDNPRVSNISSPIRSDKTKSVDTQDLMRNKGIGNQTVTDIPLARQFHERSSDGLCQRTFSAHSLAYTNQTKPQVTTTPRTGQNMDVSCRLGENNDKEIITNYPMQHSYSDTSSLTIENFDRIERLKNGENNGMLKSVKGTVRGYKDMVRRYSASFNTKGHVTQPEQLSSEDSNKIIIYTTSMTAVRSTTEACAYVKKVFRNRGLPFEERDVFIHKEHRKMLQQRLGREHCLTFPQVIINDKHIGGLKEIEELNESGQILNVVSDFERSFNSKDCSRCGGRRFINCTSCGGSKKSRKHRINREICSLRCTACNENGLILCTDCSPADTS